MGAPTWSWISRRVEKEILDKAINHMSKISDVAEATKELLEALNKGSKEAVMEAFGKVNVLEREADDIKREAFKELSEGFIHPVDREELIRLILTGDDIAAYAKAASRRATMADPEALDPEVKELALVMITKIIEATELLKEAITLMSREPKKALELADKIERIEEEVDEVRAEALAKVFRFCDRANPSACLISKEIIDALENSSDKCEDVADVVRSIAIMHT